MHHIKEYIKEYIKPILDSFHMVPIYCAIFGSHVYETATMDSNYNVFLICQSDPIYKKTVKLFTGHFNNALNNDLNGNIDLLIHSFDQYKELVSTYDPVAIELLLVPEKFIVYTSDTFQNYKKSVDFSDRIVRKSIQTRFTEISDIIKNNIDYSDIKNDMKSEFHSHRILLFGIQIGSWGFIYNWSIANDYLKMIEKENEKDYLLFKILKML
jgi:hypothetical protein